MPPSHVLAIVLASFGAGFVACAWLCRHAIADVVAATPNLGPIAHLNDDLETR